MKKFSLCIITLVLLSAPYSLARGPRLPAYLEVEGGAGVVTMPYKQSEFSDIFAGVNFDIGAKYALLFNSREGWGMNTGLFISSFQGSRILNTNLAFPAIDDQGDAYELRVKIQNWNERQQLYYISIPVNAFYQIVRRQDVGFYTSFGLKLYIPVYGYFSVPTGDVTTSGYYEQWGGTLIENLPQHGFGYRNDFHPSGKLNPNFAISFNAQVGAVFQVRHKQEMVISAYAEHGLNNILNPSDDVALFQTPYTYSGYYKSNLVSNTFPLTLGVKITYRFKDIHGCNCIR